MPATVRRLIDDPVLAAPRTAESGWSGEFHGGIAAMHREIEQRLLAGERLAVIPLAARPVDALVTAMSRLGGWAAFGCGVAVALALLIR